MKVFLLLVVTVALLSARGRAQGGPGMMAGGRMAGRGPSGMVTGMPMGHGGGGMMMGGQGPMNGMGAGGGMGGGGVGAVFMSLLSQHDKIQRQVKDTDKGIESLTESSDPAVAALIKTHVQQMQALLDSCAKGKCSHTPRYFDPLFRAVYSNADKLDLKATNTDKGVRAVETGTTEAARLLVQAHAAVVSKFVQNGMDEHHKTHEVPPTAKQALN